MSWGAQNRSKDAKILSAALVMSEKPELDLRPVQQYGAASRVLNALLYTKPSTHPPARAWAERHHPGVVGDPATGCIPS
jgi:hypothetical protein